MTTNLLPVPGGTLSWSMIDLTPPWIENPPVVVMHHGIGACAHIFDDWLPALIGTHRVLRFDMRGHGTSSRPDPAVPIDMKQLANDILAVMDAAGVATAHLVGESIGGTIVLYTALQAPERVRSVTVSNGAHVGGSIQAVSGWREMIHNEGMGAWSEFMMRGRFHDGILPEDKRTWFAAQQATADPDAVLRLLQALVETDLTSGLPDLHQPVLLLHPDESPFIPVPVAAELCDKLPDARLHVIGRARHGLPFSHASQCALQLRAFLLDDDSPVDPVTGCH